MNRAAAHRRARPVQPARNPPPVNGGPIGYRTCYNCSKWKRCKLLRIAGINTSDMANKCPDISPIDKAEYFRR